jgi:two-component system cell cycle response regulator DivK
MNPEINILYVEDDPINGLIMKKLLGKYYAIELVENGELALDLLQNRPFDLILMDINLGNHHMDGTETMKIIKTMKGYEDLPVYAVTSYAMPEDRAYFLKQGFDAYFSKPIDHHLIKEAIELKFSGNNS